MTFDAAQTVCLFSDGSCLQQGGWAYVLVWKKDPNKIKRGLGSASDTTNTHMELQVIIDGPAVVAKKMRRYHLYGLSIR
jgi:ribonuclease HI